MARSSQLKARGKTTTSRRRSVLSTKGAASAPGESAAVHRALTSLAAFGDGLRKGDHEPVVGRTVETLTVAERDASAPTQEEEARTVGGIPSR